MNLVELGQKIRGLRIERGMTLDDVVSRSGLTRSWLSKVENFRVTPSLPALGEIAKALGVKVSTLLEDLDKRPEFVLVKSGDGLRVSRDSESSNIVYESLAHERPDRAMDPFVLTVPPGGGRSKNLSHEGEEFLRVLSARWSFTSARACTNFPPATASTSMPARPTGWSTQARSRPRCSASSTAAASR